MASIVFLDPGGGATGGTEFWSSSAGTSTVDTATKLASSDYSSLKLLTGSPAVTQSFGRSGVLADAGRRLSCWFRFDTAPSAQGVILQFDDGTNSIFRIFLTAGRKLAVINASTLKTGATVLSTNTWYRISVSYVVTATNNFTIKVYLNGTQEISVTQVDGSLSRTGSTRLVIACPSAFGANVSAWFAHLFLDDGTDLADTGDRRMVVKRPVSNGSVNTFDTTAGGGSGYGSGRSIYVNDRPLSTANRVSHANNGTTASEAFTAEAVTVGDLDVTGLTLVGWTSWAHCSGVSTDQVYDNGSKFTASITSSASVHAHATTSSSYPSNQNACGLDRPTANATDAVLNECGIVLAVNPGITGTVAATQASQSVAASGHLDFEVTAATNQASQSAAASGRLDFRGTAATSQSAQSAAATGRLDFRGTAASAQGVQSASAVGHLDFEATGSTTQPPQSASGSGAVTLPSPHHGGGHAGGRRRAPQGPVVVRWYAPPAISGRVATAQAAQQAAAVGRCARPPSVRGAAATTQPVQRVSVWAVYQRPTMVRLPGRRRVRHRPILAHANTGQGVQSMTALGVLVRGRIQSINEADEAWLLGLTSDRDEAAMLLGIS